MKNVKMIVISGKFWFDKVYGNSYYSAIVEVFYSFDEVRIFEISFSYGNESLCKQQVLKLLYNLGIIPVDNPITLKYDYGIRIEEFYTQVRKRDLKKKDPSFSLCGNIYYKEIEQ